MFQAVAIGVAQADVVLTPPGNNRGYANVRWENYENYTYEISCGAKIVTPHYCFYVAYITISSSFL